MDTLARSKGLFIGLSCSSLACLIAAFANPLQKLEVWRQQELGAFNNQYYKTFIISENERNYPYGFNLNKATKIAQVYQDYKSEKILLLVAAIAISALALQIGGEVCLEDEINQEITEVKQRGKKELILESVKHRLAMASKSQRLLFLDEMKALMEEFGTIEGEVMEADEINAFYEQAELPAEETREEDFRTQFPESMDATYWKAIQKGKDNGLSETEIATDVLGCSRSQVELGFKYVDFLAHKFMTVR
jgi:hypothetical protein